MTSRRIDLMITAIKNQNKYDYKIIEEKNRINENIQKYKNMINKKRKIRKEILSESIDNFGEKTNNSDYRTKDPLESIECNSKPLIPIFKNDTYNYVNKYNFNRKKILNQNKKNRMKINKSMDMKLNIYTFNKNKYMNDIKKLFNQRNVMNKKKTQMILEHIKQSNDELRKNINMKQAKLYDNFINILKLRKMENKKNSEILNNKMRLVKYRNNINLATKLKQIKISVFNNEIKSRNKNIKTINIKDKKRKLILNREKLEEESQKNKEKIIEKENKYFLKAQNAKDEINEKKNKSLIKEMNKIKQNEIKLNKTKAEYEKIYKNEVIYKSEN